MPRWLEWFRLNTLLSRQKTATPYQKWHRRKTKTAAFQTILLAILTEKYWSVVKAHAWFRRYPFFFFFSLNDIVMWCL